nr:hypothetical protein HmN_000292800 [Hymenolepis microstoma]
MQFRKPVYNANIDLSVFVDIEATLNSRHRHPNFNYPPSTLKTIGPTNSTTTTTSSTTSIGTLYSTSKAARPSLHHQNYLYQQPQMP